MQRRRTRDQARASASSAATRKSAPRRGPRAATGEAASLHAAPAERHPLTSAARPSSLKYHKQPTLHDDPAHLPVVDGAALLEQPAAVLEEEVRTGVAAAAAAAAAQLLVPGLRLGALDEAREGRRQRPQRLEARPPPLAFARQDNGRRRPILKCAPGAETASAEPAPEPAPSLTAFARCSVSHLSSGGARRLSAARAHTRTRTPATARGARLRCAPHRRRGGGGSRRGARPLARHRPAAVRAVETFSSNFGDVRACAGIQARGSICAKIGWISHPEMDQHIRITGHSVNLHDHGGLIISSATHRPVMSAARRVWGGPRSRRVVSLLVCWRGVERRGVMICCLLNSCKLCNSLYTKSAHVHAYVWSCCARDTSTATARTGAGLCPWFLHSRKMVNAAIPRTHHLLHRTHSQLSSQTACLCPYRLRRRRRRRRKTRAARTCSIDQLALSLGAPKVLLGFSRWRPQVL